jgi:exodeoxyribonuclease-3
VRILTWNCGMALARKAPNLLALNPDIAIVQECSKKSVDVLHGHGLSGRWFGANPNKGLAVFCSAEFKLEGVDKLFGKWVVPVRVHGAVVDFNLPAIWACPVGTRRTDNYIGEVHRCLVKHRGWFSNAPAVAAGDFNSNVQWDANPPRTEPRRGSASIRRARAHQCVSTHIMGRSKEARNRNAPNLLLLPS